MRHFVVVGQRARSSPDFLLDDLPGTSGRMDVLVGALRAALMVSHGVRANTCAHLVLLGGPEATVLRFRGDAARFLRPDERSLATLVRKCLERPATRALAEVRPGIDLAHGDLADALGWIASGTTVLLDERGSDLRATALPTEDAVFIVGDDRGFTAEALAMAEARGALRVSVGGVSLHAADAIAVVQNELDRREGAHTPVG